MQPLRLFNPSHDASKIRPDDIRGVVALFLRHKQNQFDLGGCVAASLLIVQTTLADFARERGSLPVARCGNGDLISWIADHAGWESPHTKTHRMGLVVSCFRWAAKERLIDRCPFERDATVWPTPMPRDAITPAEYAAIMREARPRQRSAHRTARFAFRRALAFLWETGARTCEMKCVRWDQIDLLAGVAVLEISKTSRKTGEKRAIALSEKIVRLLRWIKRQTRPKPNDHVFLNSRGTVWTNSSFGTMFRKTARRCGVRLSISAYSLRHGFCVRGLEMGVGERQLADLMGHASTKHIAWYGRTAKSKLAYLKGTLDAMNRPAK